MGQALRRLHRRSLGENVGVLFLLSAATGIVWTLVTRLGVSPLAHAIIPQTVLMPPEMTLTVVFIFFAWAGGWFSVVYAEQLRESAARADEAQLRVVELETLLGETQQAGVASGAAVSELWVPTRGGVARLPAHEITTLTAEREYVRLRSAEGAEHLVRASLRGLHARLDPAAFVQVHRSVVVNVGHVSAIDRRATRGWEIVLRDGRRIPVGRNYEAAVRQIAERRGRTSRA
jgi:hypothetical protein